MKLYYPYFNLFYKKGTTDYRLEVLVKMPGNCYKETIKQVFTGKYWEVRIKLREKKDENLANKEKTEEFKIELTPAKIEELEKIKIIMCVQPEMFAKGCIVHILINKRKTCIWVTQISFPILVTVAFTVKSQNNTSRMIGDQVGNIGIVQQDGTIELADIQGIFFWNIPLL